MSALSERQRGEVRAMIDEVMGEGPKPDPRVIEAFVAAAMPEIVRQVQAATRATTRPRLPGSKA